MIKHNSDMSLISFISYFICIIIDTKLQQKNELAK
jgi:hypothetical protein